MSGPAKPPHPDDDPALDDGLLTPDIVLEFHGHHAVARQGGLAVLPWRSAWLAATNAGIPAVGHPADIPAQKYAQALVRIQKGRAATQADFATALRFLTPGGRLVMTGPNTLGPATWEKRLSESLKKPVKIITRAKARAALFIRSPASKLAGADANAVRLGTTGPEGCDEPSLIAPPGVFSHDDLDAGTAALVSVIAATPPDDPELTGIAAAATAAMSTESAESPAILDLGCGIGHLAIAALCRWPQARANLLDADARAVAAARANLAALKLTANVHWWDASEALPAGIPATTLALINPPAHAGTANDLSAARAMFRVAVQSLAPHGLLLIVANRQLPYEADLAALGALRVAPAPGGFKIMAVSRRP